ncbi:MULTISPECIES: hypothetical protein [Methylobacterium]|uniref:hypothetical protein n=1 Tax=Methylobacterium TaxID=407 RepID=UPI00272E5EC8|nr:hypothetical protein [Methylobacterium sp.]
MRHWREAAAAALCLAALWAAPAEAQDRRWATAWAGSVQGPYPVGNPSAQPDQSFAFPDPAEGARDQTLRLVLRPDL